MRGAIVLTFLFLLAIIPFSSAVLINEFTTDPQTDWDNSGSATTSDEFIELYNPSNSSVDLTNWTLFLDDTSNETEILSGTISAFGYLTIFPVGSQNNDGQIQLLNAQGAIQDAVSYGSWDDGNPSDNAPDGNADSIDDECLSRIPNGQDTDQDSIDFQKKRCTYGTENGILPPNEQGLIVTIAGKIVLEILPRLLDFGLVQPGSLDNPALNGPISFNASGSEQNVNVEVTEVIGYPFDTGLKIDGNQANGSTWTLPTNSQYQEATPTLDVPEDAPAGNPQGTIVYTITGEPPQ